VNTPSRWESAIEAQIRRAQERGDFDNLPGKGKPLPGLDGPDDEMWWVKGYIQREGLSTDALLPTSLQLRKQIQELPDTVRGLRSEQAVRDVVGALNTEVAAWLRAPSGPRVPIRPVNLDDVLATWRADRPQPLEPPASADGPDPAPPKRSWWRRTSTRHAHR
jgi:hypothetical protein